MHEQYAQYRENPSCIATKVWIIKGWKIKMREKIKKVNSMYHQIQPKDLKIHNFFTAHLNYSWTMIYRCLYIIYLLWYYFLIILRRLISLTIWIILLRESNILTREKDRYREIYHFLVKINGASFHLLGRFLTKRILTQAELICAASGPYSRDVTKRD